MNHLAKKHPFSESPKNLNSSLFHLKDQDLFYQQEILSDYFYITP